MSRVEVKFLVPHREDESLGSGGGHPPFRWLWLEDELEQRFGGWSILNDSVRGVWVEPKSGKRIEDVSREYVVDVEENRLEEMRELIGHISREFCQICVRVVICGEVEYIERAESNEDVQDDSEQGD